MIAGKWMANGFPFQVQLFMLMVSYLEITAAIDRGRLFYVSRKFIYYVN